MFSVPVECSAGDGQNSPQIHPRSPGQLNSTWRSYYSNTPGYLTRGPHPLPSSWASWPIHPSLLVVVVSLLLGVCDIAVPNANPNIPCPTASTFHHHVHLPYHHHLVIPFIIIVPPGNPKPTIPLFAFPIRSLPCRQAGQAHALAVTQTSALPSAFSRSRQWMSRPSIRLQLHTHITIIRDGTGCPYFRFPLLIITIHPRPSQCTYGYNNLRGSQSAASSHFSFFGGHAPPATQAEKTWLAWTNIKLDHLARPLENWPNGLRA